MSRVPVGRFCCVGVSDAAVRAGAWPAVVKQAQRLHEIGLWRRGDLITTEADLEPERFYHETTVLGALTLSTVADRHSRRGVIVAVDSIRALVVAAMVIPGIGLPWLCILVAVMSFLGGSYKAAQLALLRDVSVSGRHGPTPDHHPDSCTCRLLLGGILSVALGPGVCLGIDAATFASSALLIGRFVRSRSAPESPGGNHSIVAGFRAVWDDPRRWHGRGLFHEPHGAGPGSGIRRARRRQRVPPGQSCWLARLPYWSRRGPALCSCRRYAMGNRDPGPSGL